MPNIDINDAVNLGLIEEGKPVPSLGDMPEWMKREKPITAQLADIFGPARGMMQGSPADEMLTELGWENENAAPDSVERVLMDAMFGSAGMVKAMHGGHAGIEKWSMDAARTGEGGAALGAGGYFTEAEGVAKYYRDKVRRKLSSLADEGVNFGPLTGERVVDEVKITTSAFEAIKKEYPGISEKIVDTQGWDTFINRMNQVKDDVMTGPMSKLGTGKQMEYWEDSLRKQMTYLLQDLRMDMPLEMIKAKPIGAKAVMNAEQNIRNNFRRELSPRAESLKASVYDAVLWKNKKENLLDWGEKVPREQMLQIRESTKTNPYINAGEATDITAFTNELITPFGSDAYRFLTHKLGSKQAASNFLKEAGIDGVRAPVGSIGGHPSKDKYNYVVFDAEDIILKER